MTHDDWADHDWAEFEREAAELTDLLASDHVAQQALITAARTPVEEGWLDKPITAQDVSDAVTRFAPSLPPTEFAAFVDWNCEHWEGVPWADALPWNLQTEWLAFLDARRAAADGVTTTNP